MKRELNDTKVVSVLAMLVAFMLFSAQLISGRGFFNSLIWSIILTIPTCIGLFFTGVLPLLILLEPLELLFGPIKRLIEWFYK